MSQSDKGILRAHEKSGHVVLSQSNVTAQQSLKTSPWLGASKRQSRIRKGEKVAIAYPVPRPGRTVDFSEEDDAAGGDGSQYDQENVNEDDDESLLLAAQQARESDLRYNRNWSSHTPSFKQKPVAVQLSDGNAHLWKNRAERSKRVQRLSERQKKVLFGEKNGVGKTIGSPGIVNTAHINTNAMQQWAPGPNRVTNFPSPATQKDKVLTDAILAERAKMEARISKFLDTAKKAEPVISVPALTTRSNAPADPDRVIQLPRQTRHKGKTGLTQATRAKATTTTKGGKRRKRITAGLNLQEESLTNDTLNALIAPVVKLGSSHVKRAHRLISRCTVPDCGAGPWREYAIFLATRSTDRGVIHDCFRAALDRQPDDAVTLLFFASYCCEMGDLALAEELYLRLIIQCPENSEALAQYGVLLVRTRRHTKAEKYFISALRADPANAFAAAHYGAMLYRIHRDASAAVELYLTALRANPTSKLARRGIAELYLGLDDDPSVMVLEEGGPVLDMTSDTALSPTAIGAQVDLAVNRGDVLVHRTQKYLRTTTPEKLTELQERRRYRKGQRYLVLAPGSAGPSVSESDVVDVHNGSDASDPPPGRTYIIKSESANRAFIIRPTRASSLDEDLPFAAPRGFTWQELSMSGYARGVGTGNGPNPDRQRPFTSVSAPGPAPDAAAIYYDVREARLDKIVDPVIEPDFVVPQERGENDKAGRRRKEAWNPDTFITPKQNKGRRPKPRPHIADGLRNALRDIAHDPEAYLDAVEAEEEERARRLAEEAEERAAAEQAAAATYVQNTPTPDVLEIQPALNQSQQDIFNVFSVSPPPQSADHTATDTRSEYDEEEEVIDGEGEEESSGQLRRRPVPTSAVTVTESRGTSPFLGGQPVTTTIGTSPIDFQLPGRDTASGATQTTGSVAGDVARDGEGEDNTVGAEENNALLQSMVATVELLERMAGDLYDDISNTDLNKKIHTLTGGDLTITAIPDNTSESARHFGGGRVRVTSSGSTVSSATPSVIRGEGGGGRGGRKSSVRRKTSTSSSLRHSSRITRTVTGTSSVSSGLSGKVRDRGSVRRTTSTSGRQRRVSVSSVHSEPERKGPRGDHGDKGAKGLRGHRGRTASAIPSSLAGRVWEGSPVSAVYRSPPVYSPSGIAFPPNTEPHLLRRDLSRT